MKKEEIKELAKNGKKYAKAKESAKSQALKMKKDAYKVCKDCGKLSCVCK